MTGSPMVPLLSVKHTLPPARQDAVARPRLAERLQHAPGRRLCVVVAPAGWGKTTLLAQWANESAELRRVAWVSLDESDNDPVRFWTYVLTALGGVTDVVGGQAITALSVPGVDPVSVALPLLLNEMSAMQDTHVLVLDDYHVIHDRRIHEGLEFLVTYLPPSLRVIVAGRADPPLPLARMRVRGDLSEIRADDLRFTEQESSALVAAVGGVDLERSTATALWQRTEGWAAGLQLAAIAIGDSSDPSATLGEIRGDDRHILDYFSSEILDRLEPEHRDLLVRTSVLERLSAPLCDAVLTRTGSRDVLRELDRRNLFVVPLDRHREWYRCHGLFRDVLRAELDASYAAAAPELLRRAADWFAGEDQMDEAVRHLMASGDATAAMTMLRSSEGWFFENGGAAGYLELGEQLARIPGTADPEVFLMLAYAAVLCGRFDRVVPWCEATEPLLTADTTPLAGWRSARASVLTMRAAYGHAESDQVTAVVEAQEAISLESDPEFPGYVAARVALASALMRCERFEEAVTTLTDAWGRPSRSLLPTSVVLQTAGLFGLNLLQTGRVDDARRLCEEVSERAEAVETEWGVSAAASVCWIRLVEGRVAYRSGDLSKARELLGHAAGLAEVWGRDTDLVMALTSLAEAQLADDGSTARDTVTRAREITDSEPIRPLAARELERVENRLGRGALRAARRVGRLHEELTDRELSILRALPGSATQREIGDALFLSVNTVKGYTKSLYRKLGATSRAEAVEQGRGLGLI